MIGEKFIEILNDHHLEQLVHFVIRERNILDLNITSLPRQFLDIQSPDRLSVIPSNTSRSVSSVPWITPAIRRKIRRKMQLMRKQKR